MEEVTNKINNFKNKMEQDVNNRRLARFAISKSQGWFRSYIALPYHLKYKVYINKETGAKEYTVDEITKKYENLVNSTEPADVNAVKLIDDILSNNRSPLTYFSGTIIAASIVLLLIVFTIILMFGVTLSKNMNIIMGLSIGVLLALPVFKLYCDFYAIRAWLATTNKFKSE